MQSVRGHALRALFRACIKHTPSQCPWPRRAQLYHVLLSPNTPQAGLASEGSALWNLANRQRGLSSSLVIAT